MTTPDLHEINARLASLLAQLQATPPPPAAPHAPSGAIGPRTSEEQDALCIALLLDQEGSDESIAAAKASVAEMHRRTAALEAELAEKRLTNPSYPRWSGRA